MRTIIVANRLAVRLVPEAGGGFGVEPSIGGLATGLASLGDTDLTWIGWPGIVDEDADDAGWRALGETLAQRHAATPVRIPGDEFERFYGGFCNDTVWPLFHYFPSFVEYDASSWDAYRRVNERYLEALLPQLEPGVRVWVHDYQLLLLPAMIREAAPDVEVGFFLHIPFPTFELFRLLPWRTELLEGMLGADLIGFHTYDYARHFLSSVRRVLGYDHAMGVIRTPSRVVAVDVFPMGIDWGRYAGAIHAPETESYAESVETRYPDGALVLSVDRLDYSKGIPGRLRAFGRLLERAPHLHGRVSLHLIVAPSREQVARYMDLRSEIDELVSRINGEYSTIDWVPVYYQYRTASFHELVALYRRADVLLVTPLRDGMNLVAKEYIAACDDDGGAVVLSETAGAARELSEALVVNPSDVDAVAGALEEAITADAADLRDAMAAMRRRVQTYTVQTWAQSFMKALRETESIRAHLQAKPLRAADRERLVEAWNAAASRVIVLDYDGTLVGFKPRPELARPDAELYALLDAIGAMDGTRLVISSGRDRGDLEGWFGDRPWTLAAGHGAWLRRPGDAWNEAADGVAGWRERIEPIILRTVERTPGSRIERKAFSLAWHYRNAEPELAAIRLSELRETLLGLTSNLELSVLDGNRVLEIKPAHVHKGRVVQDILADGRPEIVIAIGDDTTDEAMFEALLSEAEAERAWTIKVGVGATLANWSIRGPRAVRLLIGELAGGG